MSVAFLISSVEGGNFRLALADGGELFVETTASVPGGGSNVTGPTTFSAFTVTGAAVEVATPKPSTGSGSRLSLLIQNQGSGNLYVRSDNTVSSSNGIKLASGQEFTTNTSDSAWWVVSDGTSAVVVAEDLAP